MPPAENPGDEFRDSVEICSNGKYEIPTPKPENYLQTGLDEYVWRDDSAYGHVIVDI